MSHLLGEEPPGPDWRLDPRDHPRFRRHRGTIAFVALAGLGVVTAYVATHELQRRGPRRRGTIAARAIAIRHDSPAALLQRWRDPETMRAVFARFARVEAADTERTRWTGPGPLGAWTMRGVEVGLNGYRWTAEQSDAPIEAIMIRFRPMPGGRGILAVLSVRVAAPGGMLGRLVTGATRELVPSQIAAGALRAFKRLVETGETAPSATRPVRPLEGA